MYVASAASTTLRGGPRMTVDAKASRPRRFHSAVSILAWLLPASLLKNRVLRLLGNDIGRDVTIGTTLVLSCGRFSLADGAVISTGNVFRRMNRVSLGARSVIGRLNLITASPEYQAFDNRAGVLRMGEESMVTNRHYLDCSGMIELRYRSMIGGVKSILQSHEIDIVRNRTTIGRITIGDQSFVSTSCLLLKNAHVPDRSYVAAGSVFLANRSDEVPRPGIYAGTPAKWKSEMRESAWWDRDELHTVPQSADDFDSSL